MTFAEQLKEDYKQEFMDTLAPQLEQKGMQKGREAERYEVAKGFLAAGISLDLVKKVTKLSDLELSELEKI